VIIADNEEAKFEGMSGSDFAVAVNGEIVNECAAF
jgi:sulfur carrier protein ThiS